MSKGKVSLPVIRRLPRYYRYITSIKKTGQATVSSGQLAKKMGTTASQVRQDFNHFGGFGQQGIGYNIDTLIAELEKLLFGEKDIKAILIGTGKLGRAMSQFLANEARGLQLVAVFDNNPQEVGCTVAGVPVQNVEELATYCRKNKPEIAVICIPKSSAKELAPKLVALGIKGIWNFSHGDLPVDTSETMVENVHLGDSLASLAYRLRGPQ